MNKHDPAIRIENFMEQSVEEAGVFFTKPLLLQRRRHFSKETFEVTPMEPEIDTFLPFWWISKHPLQGTWESEEIQFNTHGCQETCTRYEQEEFSLTWDEKVAQDLNTRTIRYVSAVTTNDVLASVPQEFQPYLGIMSKEFVEAPTTPPLRLQNRAEGGKHSTLGTHIPLIGS